MAFKNYYKIQLKKKYYDIVTMRLYYRSNDTLNTFKNNLIMR